MTYMTETILKVLVGSRAHKLNRPDSDFDYRGVYVVPTTELLKIGGKTKGTVWIEGNEDNTAWELEHFLRLATQCNPTILEVFHAPMKLESCQLGIELRRLFPYLWNVTNLVNSHVGYSENQRKKFLADKDGRTWKYAVAYLRTLVQAWTLLEQGEYPVDMSTTGVYQTLQDIRDAKLTKGQVIDICNVWAKNVQQAADKHPGKETDFDKVNEFLLKARRQYWCL